MVDHNSSTNKNRILISVCFFSLLVGTLSSCSPMSEIAKERALKPDAKFKICKIGDKIGRYQLVTIMDDHKNYYSWIARDFPCHLKSGDDYPAQ